MDPHQEDEKRDELAADVPESEENPSAEETVEEGDDGEVVSEKDLDRKKLEEQYALAPTTPLAKVLSENAELKLALLHAKKANLRIWTLVGLLAVLVGVVVYAWVEMYPKYKYIVTTNNQAICQAGAADRPLVTPATLAAYAQDAVVNSYTYDYVNYREDLNRIGNTYYTDRGRAAYFDSLDQSDNLKRVIDGRYILKAYPLGSPILQSQGVNGGRRYWVVQVPVGIEFYTGNLGKPQSSQQFLAMVTVTEEPASKLNLKGIAVDNLVLHPYRR
ncbi:intracellular multiplication protein IcmL [Neisseria sp. HSC-16F19]|nr:DotI/IcmL family type IV secretion protein [Neisseria sp. HSC-16F19]MCP2041166.1 intracellular multiplication protein IcmL [Neisseria sp. HSC-16F19]